MNTPTYKQIQWFWEQCGFEVQESYRKNFDDGHTEITPETWLCPDKEDWLYMLPSIDPNNLFKYAVLELANYNLCKCREPMTANFGTHYAQAWGKLSAANYGECYDIAPALALFWAIYKALGGKQ